MMMMDDDHDDDYGGRLRNRGEGTHGLGRRCNKPLTDGKAGLDYWHTSGLIAESFSLRASMESALFALFNDTASQWDRGVASLLLSQLNFH